MWQTTGLDNKQDESEKNVSLADAFCSNATRIMSSCHVTLPLLFVGLAHCRNRSALLEEPLENTTDMTTQSTLRDPRQIQLSDLVATVNSPEQKIRYDEDVTHWKHTTGYHDYQLFLRRLNESIVGHAVPGTSDSDAASEGYSQVGQTHSFVSRPALNPHVC